MKITYVGGCDGPGKVPVVYKKSMGAIACLMAAGLAVQGAVILFQPTPSWPGTTLALLLLAAGAGLGLIALGRVQSEVVGLIAEIVRLRKEGVGAPIPGHRGPLSQRLARPINSLATHLARPDPQALAHQELVLEALRLVIGGRPYATRDHNRRVAEMSYQLARLAGLKPVDAELLRLAAPLHDLGLAGIPESVRGKKGQFTPADARILEKHTELGYRLLRRLDGPICRAAATIALEHHERWDGKGYPNRYAGEEIHVYSRILAIVDMFETMHGYRNPRQVGTREKVLGIMRCQRGHHFDPQLLDVFMANLPVFYGILEGQGRPVKEDPSDKGLGAEPASILG